MSPEKPHYFGHRKPLPKRFLKNGLEGFVDYEVVGLLLIIAIPRLDIKEPANEAGRHRKNSVWDWMRQNHPELIWG